MAGKTFTYYIKYPENDSPVEDDDEKNSFEVIHKSDAGDLPPVIVLLGWAGCQEKHLMKYTSMYEKKGYITVSLIVPAKTLFFRANKMPEVAQGLLQVLEDKGLAKHPTFFHIFSNGGCMVYSQLSTILNARDSSQEDKFCLRGVIFDSSPGKHRILNAVRAFMSTLKVGLLLKYLLGLCLLLYLVSIRFMRALMPGGFYGMAKGFQLFDAICVDPTPCPQLFLYSKADKVILAEDVEEVMTARKERGVKVQSVCWDDSHHVAHLRQHREVYSKTCMDFVDACLAL